MVNSNLQGQLRVKERMPRRCDHWEVKFLGETTLEISCGHALLFKQILKNIWDIIHVFISQKPVTEFLINTGNIKWIRYGWKDNYMLKYNTYLGTTSLPYLLMIISIEHFVQHHCPHLFLYLVYSDYHVLGNVRDFFKKMYTNIYLFHFKCIWSFIHSLGSL